MRQTATIKVDRHGIGSVVVDGHDISMSISPEFTLTNSVHGGPVLTLRLVGLDLEVEADAKVAIPNDVAEALEALGWKRPEASA
jgi:hypothetical protein